MLNGTRVLVAGATGYLGRYVAREFKSRGCFVQALVRSPEKLGNSPDHIDEVSVGRVTYPPSLRGICEGMDLVFSSVGITRQKDGLTYMEVDYQGNLNLLREAQRSGVSRFIYISVFNADKMRNLKIVRAKLEFEKELKASGLDYTIIRPNGFFFGHAGLSPHGTAWARFCFRFRRLAHQPDSWPRPGLGLRRLVPEWKARGRCGRTGCLHPQPDTGPGLCRMFESGENYPCPHVAEGLCSGVLQEMHSRQGAWPPGIFHDRRSHGHGRTQDRKIRAGYFFQT